MTNISRRRILQGGATGVALATVGTGASALVPARRTELNFTDPAFNVEALARILGDSTGKPTWTWSSGRLFAARKEGEFVDPILDYQGCKVITFRPIADGGFEMRFRGTILFMALGESVPLEIYKNPWNGNEAKVTHFRTSLGRIIYTPKGIVPIPTFKGEMGDNHSPFLLPWERVGDDLWVTLDERVRYQRPSDNEWRVDNAINRYRCSASELANPKRTSVAAEFSWHTQLNWMTFLGMGDAPGGVMWGGAGKKYASLDALPTPFVDAAEKRFPGILTKPIDWS